MLQQALQKLQDEMATNKAGYVTKIGSFLMEHVRKNPEHAVLIAAQEKSIKGCIGELRNAAQKIQSDGCGVLTDEEGFEIVKQYYGVQTPAPVTPPAADAGLSVNIDDLL